jgi:hypothetical protein
MASVLLVLLNGTDSVTLFVLSFACLLTSNPGTLIVRKKKIWNTQAFHAPISNAGTSDTIPHVILFLLQSASGLKIAPTSANVNGVNLPKVLAIRFSRQD